MHARTHAHTDREREKRERERERERSSFIKILTHKFSVGAFTTTSYKSRDSRVQLGIVSCFMNEIMRATRSTILNYAMNCISVYQNISTAFCR